MEKLALRTRLEIAAHAHRLRLSNHPEMGGSTVGDTGARDDPARAASFISTSQRVGAARSPQATTVLLFDADAWIATRPKRDTERALGSKDLSPRDELQDHDDERDHE